MKVFFTLMLFAIPAFATMDLSKYDLTPKQIETVRMFEAKGKSEEFLLKLISAIEKSNYRAKHPPYVPKHTQKELEDVASWAVGGAFYSFSNFAGYQFDIEAYKADCPNWEIFNFGRATAKEYFRVDVLYKTINVLNTMQFVYARDKSPEKTEFKKYFFEQSKYYGMEKYLK